MVHSYYVSRNPSGENAVVDAEIVALQRAGFEVGLFAAHTDAVEGDRLYPLRAALRVATGHGRSPLEAIMRWRPDVVHVHNLFPNFGRRWLDELAVPVVHTLHNYRPLCANGLLFRDGGVCTLCPDGRRLSGLRHACYRDSRIATAPLTAAGLGGPMRDPLLARADRLLVLSPLQRDIYVSAGVPAERLTTAPNFLPDDLDPGVRLDEGETYIGVGRLTPEKGFTDLARIWPREHRLLIVGDGPERAAIERIGNPSVELLGLVPRPEAIVRIRTARALVFPSRCFEGAPLVHIEAQACGTPVLAAAGNSVAAMLDENGGGAVTDWDSWPDGISGLAVDRSARAGARAVFENSYGELAYVARTRELYERLCTPPTSR